MWYHMWRRSVLYMLVDSNSVDVIFDLARPLFSKQIVHHNSAKFWSNELARPSQVGKFGRANWQQNPRLWF